MVRFIFLHILVLFAVVVGSAEALASCASCVARVDDATHVTLGAGTKVHLTGVHAPFDEAGAARAKAALEKTALGKTVLMQNAGPDREANIWAQLFVLSPLGQKTWIQALMVRNGLLFFAPSSEAADVANGLLEQEALARGERRGLWDDEAYRDLTPDEAVAHTGDYAFVVGRVRSVARGKNGAYLNFGDNWRQSLSVFVPEKAIRSMRGQGRLIDDLDGERIRVRGKIERKLSLVIEASEAEQISRLKAGPER
jgi:endonuclease YncB( thermonuclease family)